MTDRLTAGQVVTGVDHSHSGDATAWWRGCLSAPPPPAPGNPPYDFLLEYWSKRRAQDREINATPEKWDGLKRYKEYVETHTPDAPPPPAPDEYARLKADLADISVQWPGLNSPRQAIEAIEALRAERDAAVNRVFQYDSGNGYMRSMTAPHVEKHMAELNARAEAAEADAKRLRDKAENVVIAHGMGWDMDGAIEDLQGALAQGGNDG